MVWHPVRYAELLAAKMKGQGVNAWLVNTGWSGGAYGTGTRMKLSYTRAIIDAIHAGALADAPTVTDPVFGFEVVTACPNVPDEILLPRSSWPDPAAFDAAASRLAGLFRENFKNYAADAGGGLRGGGPGA